MGKSSFENWKSNSQATNKENHLNLAKTDIIEIHFNILAKTDKNYSQTLTYPRFNIGKCKYFDSRI